MTNNAFNINISINKLIKLINYAFDDFKIKLRYIGHIINFIIQAFFFADYSDQTEIADENNALFRRFRPHDKLRNIVKHIKANSQR